MDFSNFKENFNTMKIFSSLLISSLFLFNSCSPELEPPVIQSGDTDFTRFIVVGDGYLSGYQDGALFKDGQSRSIAALVFSSMAQAGGDGFNQALMPDNTGLGMSSKPWEGLFITASKMADRTNCEGEVSIGPVKSFHNVGSAQPYLDPVSISALNDFAFPFTRMSDLFNPNYSSQNVFYNRVAASFGNVSVMNAALTRNPTFFMAWPGLEDIFHFARNGGRGVSLLTASDFSLYLDSLIAPLALIGADGVLATIPELDAFPYYTTIPWNVADLTQDDADTANVTFTNAGMTHISFQVGKNALVMEDPAAPFGYRQMIAGEFLTLIVPTDSMKCYYYGLIANVIHDRYVLDTAEVSLINSRITQFNNLIRQKAAQYNLAVADMNGYFNQVKTGILSQGVLFTNEFARGGFFGLDGYYPTQKGAALIANQFILAINSYYHSSLPTIRCEECNGVLFP